MAIRSAMRRLTSGASTQILTIRPLHHPNMRLPSYTRRYTSTLQRRQQEEDRAIFFPLPKLAPNNVSGSIKWLKKEGDPVDCYEVILEITTDTLTEEAQGPVTLLIESHEEGHLARILKDEKDGSIAVGTPIAVLCEEASDIKNVSRIECLYPDLYSSEAQKSSRLAIFQAYLKK